MPTSNGNLRIHLPRWPQLARGMLVAFGITASVQGAEPAPIPQRYFPAQALTAYVEYDGLKAHAAAWNATAAHAMLNDTPAGSMLSEIVKQISDRLLKEVPGARLKGADVLALHDELTGRGFAAALYLVDDDSGALVTVLKGMGRKESRDRLERIVRTIAGDTEIPKPTRIRGRDVYQDAEPARGKKNRKPDAAQVDPRVLERTLVENENARLAGVVAVVDEPNADDPAPAEAISQAHDISAWFEGEDLVIVDGPPAAAGAVGERKANNGEPRTHKHFLDAVFDTIEGKQKSAAEHPGFRSAIAEGKDLKGFEPDGLFFIEVGPKATQAVAGVAAAAGGMASFGNVTVKPSADVLKFFKGPSAISAAAEQIIGLSKTFGGLGFPSGGFVVPGDGEVPRIHPGRPGNAPAPAPVDAARIPPPCAPPAFDDEPKAPAPVDGVRITPSPSAPHVAANVEQAKEDEKAIEPAAVLGLDGIHRIVGRWGFQGKSLVTDVRIEAPAPRKGLLKLWFDQPAITVGQLPPIPRGVTEFTYGSFDLEAAYSTVLTLAREVEPGAAGTLAEVEAAVRTATGLRLREDLLRHVGPAWAVVTPPSRAAGTRKSDSFDPRDYLLVAGVKDPQAFGAVIDKLAAQANAYLRSLERGAGDAEQPKKEPEIPVMLLEKLPAPDRGYRITSPAGIIPWLDDEVEPTILIGRSCVVLAANLEQAREVLAAEQNAENRWTPDGALANVFEGLPGKLTFFSLGDPRNSAWPDALAHMPGTVQYLIGLVELGAAEGEPDTSAALTLIGIPRRGAFRLRLGPSSLPKARDLRSHLFPSILAATVDDRGLRIILREAFPLACVPMDVNVKK